MANLTYEEAIEAFEYRDGELFWKIKPAMRVQIGDKAGRAGKERYERFRYKDKNLLVHRVIFLMHHQHTPKEIDHINGNKLDNRIENLREATRSQNQYNKNMMSNNTSGYRGVSWNNQKNKWAVRVKVNKKSYNFGFFDDLDVAGAVASEARAKLHGEFARAA